MALTTSQIVRVINRYQRFLDTTVVIVAWVVILSNSLIKFGKDGESHATKDSPSGLGFDKRYRQVS